MRSFYRFIGAGIGLFGLIVQYYLIIKPVSEASLFVSETIRFLSFMTIWSNIVVTAAFLVPLLAPRSGAGQYLQRPTIESAITVYIFIVMLVYHFFLAKVWNPQGWQKVVDITLHYIVPLLYLFYWILFSQKAGLRYIHTVYWLLYPAVYVVYSLLRGAITGLYPYYFADVAVLGYPVAMRNMLLVIIAYWLVGMILVMLTRLIPAFPNRSATRQG